MEITENLINQLNQSGKKHFLVGICGRAGSGKTTLADKVTQELRENDIGTTIYSGDWRFILDSNERKKWLEERWKSGIDAYIFAINQLTWWDFKKISGDLEKLSNNISLDIDDVYERKTGKKDIKISIPPIARGIILYENCILGGIEILEKLDLIVILNTPDEVCLERMIKKDEYRRSVTDIASRFIITTYNENNFFEIVLNNFNDKLLVCDSDGRFDTLPRMKKVSQIPVFIPDPVCRERLTGTIFCDLDGTVIKHIPIPSEDGKEIEVLPKTVEKLREWSEKGYYIIMTSSRPYNKIYGLLNKLKSLGIEFDRVICDLPLGPRHLINDSKGNEVRAFAHVLKRDKGLGEVKI